MRLFLIFSLNFLLSYSQQFYTETGYTEFDGSKAAFEPIKAKNSSSISIIDIGSGKIAALIGIKDFDFRLGLMQEHFNENYLESNKFPKSTFEGKILNYDQVEFKDYFTDVSIEGILTIKGVSKKIITNAQIKKNNDKIELKSSFSVKLSDYKIKVPRIVFMKIDETVKINLSYLYEKKEL